MWIGEKVRNGDTLFNTEHKKCKTYINMDDQLEDCVPEELLSDEKVFVVGPLTLT